MYKYCKFKLIHISTAIELYKNKCSPPKNKIKYKTPNINKQINKMAKH